MRILFTFICCLLFYSSRSQVVDSSVITLSDVRYFDSADKKYSFLSTPKGLIQTDSIPFLSFPPPEKRKSFVADSMIERDCYVRFTISNSADTIREVYFIPAYYLKKLDVFIASPSNIAGTFRLVPKDTQNLKVFSGCQLIRVNPGESLVCFARFNFLRTNINSYTPRIIDKNFLWSWVMMVKNKDTYLNVITYLGSGILVLMIFYSMAVYLQNRNNEFIFYSLYVLCSVVLLFLKAFLNFQVSAFNYFFEEYLDFMIMGAGTFFYLSFIRKFLNTGTREPFLEKALRYAEVGLAVLLVFFSLIYFLTDKYIILNILENYVIKLLMFIISFIVIIYSFKKKDPLLNYLAAGNIALVFFSMISLGIIIFKWRFVSGTPTSILNRSMLYYELGLVLELMFFLFGLAYKNKKDIIAQVKEREQFKLEAERKEFEKQMAMMAVRQEERDRISADMHDDLGSGVTAIRLMSEIVKSKLNAQQFPEIEKISHSANELLGKMNSIIWTMKSSNDTLESLVAYLRAYATEYFDNTSVECIITISNIRELEMSGEKRRNIFLSFKETLNNILKHAQATEVKITMQVKQNNILSIHIHDNGVGIDLKNIRRFGNGLNNIKKRIQSIDGEFIIGNNNGTEVCFELNLA